MAVFPFHEEGNGSLEHSPFFCDVICFYCAWIGWVVIAREEEGVPRQHISGIKKGRRAISRDMAKKLAEALSTSPGKFFLI